MERSAVVGGEVHEVCESCGSIVGHGCPDSEPCEREACAREARDEGPQP